MYKGRRDIHLSCVECRHNANDFVTSFRIINTGTKDFRLRRDLTVRPFFEGIRPLSKTTTSSL